MTRPNGDGESGAIGITDFLVKVFQWWDWMDQFDRGYSHIARFARHHLLRHIRDSVQRKNVWALIVLIEDFIPVFRARGFERAGLCVGLLRETEQRLAANRCTAACAALTVYWGDPEIIQGHCNLLVGRGEQWAAFSKALTENSLKGWKDWRQHPTPLFWLKTVTDTIAEKESCDDTTDMDVLPLEEIAEMPADAVLERRFTMRSVAELEAAAKNDGELRDYVAYKVRYPDWQASELWHALGWDAARGKAVDRRYRRLRSQLRESGAGMQWRTAPVAGLTSATYFFETLYDGAQGAERGVWQHADAIPPTSLPIAPFRPDPSV